MRSEQLVKEARANPETLPYIPVMLLALDQSTESRQPFSFDYTKHSVELINVFEPFLIINDPVIIQDMMVTKNAQIDKLATNEMTFKNLFGNTFLFSPSDDVWKTKRKGLAHAFYKDKLSSMLENLKFYTLK